MACPDICAIIGVTETCIARNLMLSVGTLTVWISAASTSAALIQTVNVPTDSIKLRAMQVSVTPMIAQMSGQAIVGAIDYAIDAGFSENPQALTPNGAGFSFQTGLGQPAAAPTGSGGNRTEGRMRVGAGAGTQRAVQVTAGSLANGLQGGNGAPPGT